MRPIPADCTAEDVSLWYGGTTVNLHGLRSAYLCNVVTAGSDTVLLQVLPKGASLSVTLQEFVTHATAYWPAAGYYNVNGRALLLRHRPRRSRQRSYSPQSFRWQTLTDGGFAPNGALSAEDLAGTLHSTYVPWDVAYDMLCGDDAGAATAVSRNVCLVRTRLPGGSDGAVLVYVGNILCGAARRYSYVPYFNDSSGLLSAVDRVLKKLAGNDGGLTYA